MDNIPWDIIIPFLGSLAGWLGRHFVSQRKWAKVRKVAKEIAKDPTKTNDAREAISQALLQVQLEKIAIEAKKVEDAFITNGSNPIPKLDLVIEKIEEKDETK